MCVVRPASVKRTTSKAGARREARQGRATDRSNLQVTSGPLDRRPICLSSIIESNGVGDSRLLNKIFHICAIVNLTCHKNNFYDI